MYGIFFDIWPKAGVALSRVPSRKSNDKNQRIMQIKI